MNRTVQIAFIGICVVFMFLLGILIVPLWQLHRELQTVRRSVEHVVQEKKELTERTHKFLNDLQFQLVVADDRIKQLQQRLKEKYHDN